MKSLFIVLLFVLSGAFACQLSAQTLDYRIQSMFIFNIAKSTKWEPEYEAGDFVVATLNNSDVSNTFQKTLSDKKINGQTIKVRNLANISEEGFYHVLFIPAGTKADLSAIITKLAGKNTLIVTEKEGWARRGSMINFVTMDGKIKFEINNTSLQKSGLKMSSSIISMALPPQ